VRQSINQWLTRLLYCACVLPLSIILVLTFVDVFMRYVFASPVSGSSEIIQMAMAITIFAGLPLITRERGHITVSLIDGLFGAAALRAKQTVCDLVSLLALVLLAWRLWEQAGRYVKTRTETLVLALPMAPLTYAMFAFTVLTIVLLVAVTYRDAVVRPGLNGSVA